MRRQAIHGGNVYEMGQKLKVNPTQLLDYSANLNPFGTPKTIVDEISQAKLAIMAYPDPDCVALVEAIGKEQKINPAYILCGNGGADLIYRIAYGLKPKKVLIVEPTFAEYEEGIRQVDAQVDYYQLDKESLQIEEDVVWQMKDDYDVMFLCNPNNPTGQVCNLVVMEQILKRSCEANITLVVDECFNDFITDGQQYSVMDKLEKYSNVLVLRSFTKMYHIPGIRLGYVACANAEILSAIRLAGQTWSVNGLAQLAGIQALMLGQSYVDKTTAYIDCQRAYLMEELRNLGCKVWESKVNYLLFYSEDSELQEKLLKKRIMIRKCDNYPGLDNHYYRIAVKGQEDNKYLVASLKEIEKDR